MKKLLTGLLILTSASAFAATDVKSYDMYAPKRASFDFVAGAHLPFGKYESNGTDMDYKGFGLGLELAYGVMDNLAVYVKQGHEATEIENYKKREGLTNTSVGVKGLIGMDNMFFYYDASYTMALLGKAETDKAFDARPVLALLAGFGADIEQFGLGAMLGFDMYQSGDEENNSVTSEHDAGNGMNWKVYAQYQPSWKVGLSYGSKTVDKTDTDDKSQTDTLSVYGIIPINAESDVFASINKPEIKEPSGVTSSAYVVEAKYLLRF